MGDRITRSMRRRRQRASAEDKDQRQQPFRLHVDQIGYDVLHDTKGWKRISGKRVFAQQRMAQLLQTNSAMNDRRSLMQRLRASLMAEQQDQAATA